ncbi:MAG: DUF2520 domain-containing protein [Sphingobacteriaceae bacterium]|nr:DUF2520 domain-containing protein [Sphingobacteriaceae bacterium]
MNSKANIALCGTGHVAWKLGEALHQAGYTISFVWGRNRSDREALARLLGAQPVSELQQLPLTELCIMALPDAVIAEVAQQIAPDASRLVLHCAGTGQLDWLAPHPRRGILWPLQSIRKELQYDWKTVPLLCDASDEASLAEILALGGSLSELCEAADQKSREAYHLAAVTTANFSNFLFEQAFDLLKQQQLDHRLLLPILRYQLDAFASNQAPWERQTGPARRGDLPTIQKQLQQIAERPAHAALYRLFSELIQNKS